ncbi:hypothetical protein HPP92_006598 [Vanilla planifolia]|uniref:Vacuolar fusion protein MON1 homolog n=1 Tax=Vanilla planifolia TaxID=51239 RepID=A0A835RKP8_VANPL|nr:hypothetical protein HPP92_006598 [Vanilla planifolia]
MASDPTVDVKTRNTDHPDSDPARDQIPTAEVRLSSLNLGETAAGTEKERLESNGSLPAVSYDARHVIVPENKELKMAAPDRDSSHGAILCTDGSEMEGEVPSSPSSSGYAGERGSSGASSGIGDEVVGGWVSTDSWDKGKTRMLEDDTSASWRKRKKHFFVLSHSGKPIYSRYGDEHKLAGFSATLQAIISFVENGGDRVKFIKAGRHQIVFFVKGPIYLVCISCTEEPYEALKAQLDLLYSQILLILTKSIDRCFEKNPKFDMTPLLGGTDAVFSSLIHSFSWNPAAFLHSYTCLPLAYTTRQAAGAILQDVADSGVMFAILMCKHKVVSLVGAQKASLHPDDILLLSNFVLSTDSFRIRIESVLSKSNVLSEVQRSILDGGLHVEDLPVVSSLLSGSISPPSHLGRHSPESVSQSGIGGPAGLWHFIYRSLNLDQYVSSEFSSPLNSSRQRKRLYRAYQKLYVSMHDGQIGPHKTQFRRDENYVLLCWVTQDFELYAAFDPLADKALAIKTCNCVCQWVRDLENEIFLFGGSPFAW